MQAAVGTVTILSERNAKQSRNYSTKHDQCEPVPSGTQEATPLFLFRKEKEREI